MSYDIDKMRALIDKVRDEVESVHLTSKVLRGERENKSLPPMCPRAAGG